MASRESQGLQVALILFVMVTVVLAVTTYLYFRRAEENVGKYLAKAEEAKREKDTTMKLQFENQVLKHILGLRPQDGCRVDEHQARARAATSR